MNDPILMPGVEDKIMKGKLKKLGYFDYLEEEFCDPYFTSVARLEKAGLKIFHKRNRS